MDDTCRYNTDIEKFHLKKSAFNQNIREKIYAIRCMDIFALSLTEN